MKILHLSDTHGLHHRIKDMPEADVIVHSGDISNNGTESEVLDFLNWYIELPYPHKIFVTGNHDLCLWEAEGIEDLPNNIYFLQDSGVEIDGIRFYGIAYNHPETLIPHETESVGIHWGNAPLRNRIMEVKPRYHLFGHSHGGYGIVKQDNIVYSNAALLNDMNHLVRKPRLLLV